MNALATQAPPSLPSAGVVWTRTLEAIRHEGLHYALTWLERMRPLEVRENALVLGVPDRFFRDWVDDHYRAMLETHLSRLEPSLGRVAYEVVVGPPPSANLSPT
ncbi:chromosomal replication initiator protein DnaA, partial [Corallococcus sp. CA053C]|uniref:DnaA N-terminal domain-containing protein n=1 Tax=Corallococcus sp. CA053C TaxID=2316732 RepID=UPI000EC1B025